MFQLSGFAVNHNIQPPMIGLVYLKGYLSGPLEIQGVWTFTFGDRYDEPWFQQVHASGRNGSHGKTQVRFTVCIINILLILLLYLVLELWVQGSEVGSGLGILCRIVRLG